MPETLEVAVAGVTFEGRQLLLAELYEAQQAGVPLVAWLHREPDNAYDSNAVRVYIDTSEPGRGLAGHVGYLSRRLAALLARSIDAGEAVRVTKVTITRGAMIDSMTYGVRIHIETQTKEAI